MRSRADHCATFFFCVLDLHRNIGTADTGLGSCAVFPTPSSISTSFPSIDTDKRGCDATCNAANSRSLKEPKPVPRWLSAGHQDVGRELRERAAVRSHVERGRRGPALALECGSWLQHVLRTAPLYNALSHDLTDLYGALICIAPCDAASII